MAFSKFRTPSNRRTLGIFLAVAVLLICLCSAVYFLDPYRLNIAPGVTVDGVDLSGKSPLAAKQTIEQALTDTLYLKTLQVRLPQETLSLSAQQLQTKVNVWKLTADAFSMGRWRDSKEPLTLGPYLSLNESYGLTALEAYANQWDTTLSQSQWSLEGTPPELGTDVFDSQAAGQKLTITLGNPEAHLDVPSAWEQILTVLDHGFSAAYRIDIPVIPTVLPDALDLHAIADAVCAEPVNDSLDMESHQLIAGSYGYCFDMEQLEKQIEAAAYGSTVSVPMELIPPDILGDGVYFRDVLGTCETKHNNNENRNTNLRLLCAALDGHIVQPGEEFSYNTVVGERTAERGYMPAPAYSGYRLVDSIGGGVCQGSTTLYNCVLLADLEVVFRACHGASVGYVPPGLDAAVNYLTTDFRFRNNWNFPIMINAEVSDGYVKMQILGTDEKDYYIKMESGTWDDDIAVYARSYKCKYSKETNEQISRDMEAYSTYYKNIG